MADLKTCADTAGKEVSICLGRVPGAHGGSIVETVAVSIMTDFAESSARATSGAVPISALSLLKKNSLRPPNSFVDENAVNRVLTHLCASFLRLR